MFVSHSSRSHSYGLLTLYRSLGTCSPRRQSFIPLPATLNPSFANQQLTSISL